MSNDKTMEADKARVLAVYPDAELYIDVFRNGACAVGSDSVGVTISAQKWSKAEAWADAASRLPAGDAGHGTAEPCFSCGSRNPDFHWQMCALVKPLAAPPEQEGDGDETLDTRNNSVPADNAGGNLVEELSPVAPAPEGEEGERIVHGWNLHIDMTACGLQPRSVRNISELRSGTVNCPACIATVPTPKAEGVEPDGDYTQGERVLAVMQIGEEFGPYHNLQSLMDADGDSIENIAVNLKMRLNRASLSKGVSAANETKGGER